MDELRKIAIEARKEFKPGEHKCKYCGQGFVRESTLAVHQCEAKRRDLQRNEKGVRIGYIAWTRFYELTQGSAKLKTYEDFCKSSLYKDFIKFGRYCNAIDAIAVNKFIDYVLTSKLKIESWTKDKVYESFLYEYLKTEKYEDALERSLKTIENFCIESNNNIFDYFKVVSNSRFATHVSNGRVSPWIIYNCESGINKLSELNEEQITFIFKWIDPIFWERKFSIYSSDTIIIKDILKETGF